MMIISKTPVRISFFGGGTDYPAYFLRKKGAVLGTTINQYVYISLNTLSDFFEHKIRIGYSKTELVKTIDEIQHPSIHNCLKHFDLKANLDIHIFADLPAKTGLGSSSSFTVGFLNALYALQGRRVSKEVLAKKACHIEQNLILENVGSQDQFHAAYGGFNLIEFSPSHIQVRPLIISSQKQKLFEDSLLIFYTGLTRFATDIAKEQIEKTKTLSNDLYLEKMYDMVYEAEEIFSSCSEQKMISKLGALLHKSWDLKKRLSSKISNPFIDKAYQQAIEAGAYGGKVCGAGGGGFLVFLAPKDQKDNIRQVLSNLLEVSFKLENEGSSIMYMKE